LESHHLHRHPHYCRKKERWKKKEEEKKAMTPKRE
jgi:hypothetical protein